MSLLSTKQIAAYAAYKQLREDAPAMWARDAITQVCAEFQLSKDQLRAVILTQEDHS